MKVAIVGSRKIDSIDIKDFISSECNELVSGGAKGVDSCVARFAKANNIPLKEFIPEYKKYGRAAPIVRNKAIVEYADKIIAFWDGKSRGTKWVIDYCEKLGVPCEIIIID